jgi:hypothetical protein
MAKVDYTKAEKNLEAILQADRMKKLQEGKTITSSRAMDYYGLSEDAARPTPEEPVERLIREMAAKEEREPKEEPSAENEKKPAEPDQIEEASSPHQEPKNEPIIEEEEGEDIGTISSTPTADVLSKTKTQSSRAPKRQALPPKKTLPSEKFLEPLSPLITLRKHLLWFKQQHFDDRYERIGTTKEEVFTFRRAAKLTPEQTQRVIELNHKAEKIKAELLKTKGSESDEDMIEREKKRHKTKRFNVRETWLPL